MPFGLVKRPRRASLLITNWLHNASRPGSRRCLSAWRNSPAEELGEYFQHDFSGFDLLAFPALVFEMQPGLWAGCVLGARSGLLSRALA